MLRSYRYLRFPTAPPGVIPAQAGIQSGTQFSIPRSNHGHPNDPTRHRRAAPPPPDTFANALTALSTTVGRTRRAADMDQARRSDRPRLWRQQVPLPRIHPRRGYGPRVRCGRAERSRPVQSLPPIRRGLRPARSQGRRRPTRERFHHGAQVASPRQPPFRPAMRGAHPLCSAPRTSAQP